MFGTFGRAARSVAKIPIPFVRPTPEPAIMGAVAMPSPTPTVEPKLVVGRPVRPQKIDDRLREQKLKPAGI